MQADTVNPVLLDRAATARRRASALRTEASEVDELIATSFRRHAAELELKAWVLEIQSGLPYDQIASAA